jgi:basic membrane protein A and related proteins
MKKILLMVTVVALIASLSVGVFGKTSSTKAPKMGLILATGGLGDQSFNDLTFAGMKRAQKELGIKFDYVETKTVADYETQQQEMADSGEYGVIVAVGFDQVDALKKVAAEYPKQKFAIIDSVVDAPNVASYLSEEQEGSFLVGALAGLLQKEGKLPQINKKNVIGIVGALDIPLIRKFIAGYMAGAKYVNPDTQVLYDYVGGFSDPTTAKEISIAMYNKGADIVFHAAGGSGLGIFQGAKEKNFLAIGCNSNQNYIDPEHIVASMMKRVDIATFSVVKETLNGTFKPGVHTLGMAQDGVGYALENSKVPVSKSIVNQVEKLKVKIKNGQIKVPTAIEDVNKFLKENKYGK